MRGIVTTTDPLEIAMEHAEEGATLHLRGRVDIDSSPIFRDRLLAVLRGPSAEAVIVDLKDVPYMDSSGIATLIEGLRIARNRHTTLCLRGLQGRLLHLFQVTGVFALFETSGCISDSPSSKAS